MSAVTRNIKPKQSRVYIFRFTVAGRGHFPTDMLRYDSCHPRSTTSLYAMEDNDSRDTREVELIGYASHQYGPTVERWRSFGWVVTDIEPITI